MNNSKKLTLGQFKELTKNLSDETPIYYHKIDVEETREFIRGRNLRKDCLKKHSYNERFFIN